MMAFLILLKNVHKFLNGQVVLDYIFIIFAQMVRIFVEQMVHLMEQVLPHLVVHLQTAAQQIQIALLRVHLKVVETQITLALLRVTLLQENPQVNLLKEEIAKVGHLRKVAAQMKKEIQKKVALKK